MQYKLLLLAGLILLAFSIYKLRQSLNFIAGGRHVIGRVIALEDVDGAYAPVFAVKADSHREIIYHHASATGPASWEIGEEAIFLYSPAFDDVRMLRYFWLFNWTIVSIAVAVPMLIIGGGYLVLRRLLNRPVEAPVFSAN